MSSFSEKLRGMDAFATPGKEATIFNLLLFNLLQNCSKKEIIRKHGAKSNQLTEVDGLTPGKY